MKKYKSKIIVCVIIIVIAAFGGLVTGECFITSLF